MLNIAIVTNWFPAGAGYVSKSYRDSLETQGAQVFIYARGGKTMKGNKYWDDDNVKWAPLHNGDIIIRHLIKWLESNSIDVVLFNEQRYWKPLIELKKRGYCIGAYIDYYTQKTVPAFDVYDFLICNTERHYSVFKWHNNAYYIPWGTDIEKFKPVSRGKQGRIIFIISAGWQLSKNADRRGSIIGLEAFLQTKGNAVLLFYSQSTLREAPSDFKKLIESDNRIKFISGTFDPFPFSNGDVYLYPSRLDGIGLTVPEALSSGLAVITTDNAPMNEFVKNDYNGKTVEVEKYLGRHDGYYWAESWINKKKLVKAIQDYINDPESWKIHKINARDYSKKRLDWSVNSKQLLEIINSVYHSERKTIRNDLLKKCYQLDREYNPGLKEHIRRALRILKRDLFFYL